MAKANGIIEVKKERVYTYINPNNPYYVTYFVGGVAIENKEAVVAKLQKMVHGTAYSINYNDIPTNVDEEGKLDLSKYNK
jgi:hypothetical protein